MDKIIVLGSDHGGYELKEAIKVHLMERGIKFIDVGTNSSASVDYPEYAHRLCEKLSAGDAELGILCCGTGIGMSMAANKHRGIRAAACSDTFSARFTRMHNNANVLCLGGRVVGAGLACDMVDLFLDTEYEGGRHDRRVAMIDALDE